MTPLAYKRGTSLAYKWVDYFSVPTTIANTETGEVINLVEAVCPDNDPLHDYYISEDGRQFQAEEIADPDEE